MKIKNTHWNQKTAYILAALLHGILHVSIKTAINETTIM
jgi:hypothetical protein